MCFVLNGRHCAFYFLCVFICDISDLSGGRPDVSRGFGSDLLHPHTCAWYHLIWW
jgi:hypothetical protein